MSTKTKLTREQKIGFYPNQDFKTKAMKPGMRSVKLSKENVQLLGSLREGDRLMMFENSFLSESPQAPHLFVIIPTAAPADDSF